MKIAVGSRSAVSLRRLAAGVFVPAAILQSSLSSSTDYLFDEGERQPQALRLPAEAERKAEALAHFITGVFEEESAGPEQALTSYRRVLTIDPGFTKLAIEVAYDYLRRGDATEAIGVLKDAIKAAPQDPEPALALSSIYLRHLRKPDLATRYAEAALKADPERFAPYEALWEIAQAQGDDATASRVLGRALKSRARSAAYWLDVADFLTSQPAISASPPEEKALAQLGTCLERAAAGAGEDAATLARIGDFYVIGRQPAKSVEFYRKAAELKPSLPKIYERLASALLETEQTAEAITVLEQVIDGNPLDVQAYDQLYRLYEAKGDLEKALTGVEQALIIDKKSLPRQRDLLLLLLRTGRIDQVIERAAEARALFPGFPFFSYLEARALMATKRNAEALAAFDRAAAEAAKVEPGMLNALFYFDYACAAQMAQHYTRAAELFQRSIELDPRNADAFNALGYMWIERGENLDEAERLVRKALEFDPNNGAYIDSLGWLFYQRGEYQKALDELLRAAKALPEPDAVVYEHIGDAYRALNRTAEALLYWQKAHQLDAGNKSLLAKIDGAMSKVAEKTPPRP